MPTELGLLNRAVASFSEWHYPWLFRQAVLENHELGVEERALFEELLSAADQERYWQSPDLAACAKAARDGLEQLYPNLPHEVSEAVVRYVSYSRR